MNSLDRLLDKLNWSMNGIWLTHDWFEYYLLNSQITTRMFLFRMQPWKGSLASTDESRWCSNIRAFVTKVWWLFDELEFIKLRIDFRAHWKPFTDSIELLLLKELHWTYILNSKSFNFISFQSLNFKLHKLCDTSCVTQPDSLAEILSKSIQIWRMSKPEELEGTWMRSA